mmetsp:Transcript_22081/g.53475  ORF Transcript_22081/g.53475 Transcript_22081/m.53475 type:complete len:486 (-) Transcript_22081:162-1619(-)
MEELRIAFLGFGSANRALARMLLEKSESEPPSDRSPARRFLRVPISEAGSSSSSGGGEGGTRSVPWRVVCIVTRRHGRVCVPTTAAAAAGGGPIHDIDDDEQRWSIDLETALRLVESGRALDRSVLSRGRVARGDDKVGGSNDDGGDIENYDAIADASTDADRTLALLARLGRTRAANIVAEAIPSDVKGDGEPAISFIAEALRSRMHVVSANKSPLAHRGSDGEETYWKLRRLARDKLVMYEHESAVMDGVPIFSLWRRAMPAARLASIRGCLNSTTTVILTQIEGDLDESGGGKTFQEALDAAKEMGIVEADEGMDVDGYDAAVKLRALLVVLTRGMDEQSCDGDKVRIPTMGEIDRDSIRDVTREDIRRAYADGKKKYRLVASARLIDSQLPDRELSAQRSENGTYSSTDNCGASKWWHATVRLQLLPPSDPLYNLSGSDASVQFHTDVLGPISIVSSNPTLVDTAYGLFSDIVRVASESKL